jgi:hypothetical protein
LPGIQKTTAGRLRADRARRLYQSKRDGVGTRRIDAKFELELGGSAGRLLRTVVAQAAEAAPSKHCRFILSAERIVAPESSSRRMAVVRSAG